MSIHQIFSNPNTSFLPSVLHKTKSNGWQVAFYALNPQTQKLERCRMKINKIKKGYSSAKEANLHAQNILHTINQKLRGGWSPFFEGENARLYEKLPDVLAKYITESKKEKRENTMRSYQSFASMLNKWVSTNCKDIYCSLFNHFLAIRYMDYLYNERDVSATTYNNQLKMSRAFFNWAKERCYVKENPFEHIKPKAKVQKTRTIVPPEIRADITKHLIDTGNYGFALVLNLVYSSLIRPNEIRHIQIKDVNIAEKYVVIPCEIAKNHKQRFSALSEKSIDLLKKINFDKYPKDFYLLGGDLVPSEDIGLNCGAELRTEFAAKFEKLI